MSCPTCKSDEPVYIEYRESNNKMAVQLLDIFTKIWCIDTRVHDDLEFMCKECPFEVKDNGHCLVKEFKCKFYPEYKDFGSMGDL